MNLNDDLVREVYGGEHHVPGEAQHVVAAVPVYDPGGHGAPRPRRGAEAADRRLPARPHRPAQRPTARRPPRQHGRGSRAGPRSRRPAGSGWDAALPPRLLLSVPEARRRPAGPPACLPSSLAPAAPAANGRPPSWRPCQWCRSVLRQDGGAQPPRREKSGGGGPAGVKRRRRRAGRYAARLPPRGEWRRAPKERGGGGGAGSQGDRAERSRRGDPLAFPLPGAAGDQARRGLGEPFPRALSRRGRGDRALPPSRPEAGSVTWPPGKGDCAFRFRQP